MKKSLLIAIVLCVAVAALTFHTGSATPNVSVTFSEHTVAAGFDGSHVAVPVDMDGDGDLDIVGGAVTVDDVAWWENMDGYGFTWEEHVIDTAAINPYDIRTADIDSDGDPDVLGAIELDNDIVWWENADGQGQAWVRRAIDGNFVGATSVYGADIDGDGDVDVLGTGWGGNDRVNWWENEDGTGLVWTSRNIAQDFLGATQVRAADIDGDGDQDVYGTADFVHDVRWWENLNGIGTSWTQYIVDGNFSEAWSAQAADMDGDGDLDLVGAAATADDIAWWENVGGAGHSWSKHLIDGAFDGAITAFATDIDGDGDTDVFGGGLYADEVAWWENTDGIGLSWTKYVIRANWDAPYSVFGVDMEGDGDMDLLSTGSGATDQIAWWRNETLSLPCHLILNASYDGSQVALDFDLYAGTQDVVWKNSVNVMGNWYPMWSTSFAADTIYQNTVSFPFPHFGTVAFFSGLVSAENGIICADMELVDTGAPAANASGEQLETMLPKLFELQTGE